MLKHAKQKGSVTMFSWIKKRKKKCPVCGKYKFTESYEICAICGWENDPVQLADENFAGGANEMSLAEARKAWLDRQNLPTEAKGTDNTEEKVGENNE